MQSTILTWGGIAGALSAVIALIVKIAGLVKRCKEYFSNLKENVDTLVEHDHNQYMAILRLTIMSEHIPLSERIAAGKEYLKLGGNGDVRKYYETELKPHDIILKGEP